MINLFRFLKPISSIVLPKLILIGLDVQDRHITFVASTRKINGSETLASGIYTLPDEAIQDGEILNAEMVREGIRAARRAFMVSRLREEPAFILSLPPHHLYTETAFFPLMPEPGLREAVRLKIETSLPWPVSEAYVDWRRLSIRDPKRIGVWIAAIKKQTLDRYLEIFLQEEIRVAACEFHLLSLARLLEVPQKGAFIFVLVDEDGLELAIFLQNEMAMHHLKRVPAGESLEQALIFEVRRLMVYAETELGFKIDQVFIFDYIASQQEFPAATTALGVKVDLFTPTGLDPKLFIASGASLRKFSAEESAINFLPPGSGGSYHEVLLTRSLNLWANIAAVFFGVFIFAGLLMYGFLAGQGRVISRESRTVIGNVEARLKDFEKTIEEADDFNRLISHIGKAADLRESMSEFLLFLYEAAAAEDLEVISILQTAKEGEKGKTLEMKIFAPTRENFLAFENAVKTDPRVKEIKRSIAELAKETNLVVNVSIRY